jgi:hypothetical protein
MNSHVLIHQDTSSSLFLLYTALLILAITLLCYWYAAKWNKENTSKLKKEEKAALKQKTKKMRLVAHIGLAVAIVLAIAHFGQNLGKSYAIKQLDFDTAIEVREDPYYGADHTDEPVTYEMSIPTSGSHSPHDLKFGFYQEKPATELLVHNQEHGDIIINYRAEADSVIIEQLKYLAKFKEAGAGVLAVPNDAIPEGKSVVVTAWTRTMELDTFDAEKIGKFIHDYINQGPEKIPPSIRRGGGTM